MWTRISLEGKAHDRIVTMVTWADTGHKSDVFYVTVPWGGIYEFHAVVYHAESCQCYKKNSQYFGV